MESNSFSVFIKNNLNTGQQRMIDAIKTIIYKTNPKLFDLLNYYDDKIFLEPLLFTYFNTKSSVIPIEQILFGYISNEFKPSKIDVVSDDKGRIYLPNIGYFATDVKNENMLLLWNNSLEEYTLVSKNKLIKYNYEDLPKIKNTEIEIYRYNHSLLNKFFVDLQNNSEIEVKNMALKHIDHLNLAFNILEKYYTEYYKAILFVTKRIFVFHSERMNSFAAIPAHGIAFFNVNEEDDELFFIEDILHQCGHIIFSMLTYDKKKYFNIDPDTPLKKFTKIENESRTVYETFHGIFTETAMNQCLDILYENNVFTTKQKHELLGRLCFILIRFKIDLESLNHEEIFTKKGLSLYDIVKTVFENIYEKRMRVLSRFDISNQPYNFSYEKFVELNPI